MVRWPVGLAALVVAVTTLFRFAPRRRQPGLSWLALGAALTVVAWLAASAVIAAYVSVSGEFSATYGPLAGIMVLLLWAFVTGVALLAGLRGLGAARGGPRGDRRAAARRPRRRRRPRSSRARRPARKREGDMSCQVMR